jgi:hypothetical protein
MKAFLENFGPPSNASLELGSLIQSVAEKVKGPPLPLPPPSYERLVTQLGAHWPMVLPEGGVGGGEPYNLERLWRCCAPRELVSAGLTAEQRAALSALSTRLNQWRAHVARPARCMADSFWAYLAALRPLLALFDNNHTPFVGGAGAGPVSLRVEYAQSVLAAALWHYAAAQDARLVRREQLQRLARARALMHHLAQFCGEHEARAPAHWSMRALPTSVSSLSSTQQQQQQQQQAEDGGEAALARLVDDEWGGQTQLEARALLLAVRETDVMLHATLDKCEAIKEPAIDAQTLKELAARAAQRLHGDCGELMRLLESAIATAHPRPDPQSVALARYARFVAHHGMARCELALARCDFVAYEAEQELPLGYAALRRLDLLLDRVREAEPWIRDAPLETRLRQEYAVRVTALEELYSRVKAAVYSLDYNPRLVDLEQAEPWVLAEVNLDELLDSGDAVVARGLDALRQLARAEQQPLEGLVIQSGRRQGVDAGRELEARRGMLDWLLGLVDARGQIVLGRDDVAFLREEQALLDALLGQSVQ